MEQSVESNSIKKFKAIASVVNCACFAHISDFKKTHFSENLVNLGMGI